MAPRDTADAASHMAGPGYGVAGLFIVLPLLDTAAQAWPWAPGNATWRYGTVGTGANYFISYVFGIALACAIAAVAGHRKTLRAVGVVAAVSAVLVVIGTIGFAIDSLQLRPAVPRTDPNGPWLFDVGATKVTFKYAAGAFVLAWLAHRCRRGWRSMPVEREKEVPALVGKHSG